MEFLCPACQFVFTDLVAPPGSKLACPRCGRTLRLPAWLLAKLAEEADQREPARANQEPALESCPGPTELSVAFSCLRCGRGLHADASRRGLAVACPCCSATLAVPPGPTASIPVARLAPEPSSGPGERSHDVPLSARAQPALLIDAGPVDEAVRAAPLPKAVPVAMPVQMAVEVPAAKPVLTEVAHEEELAPANNRNPAVLVLGAFFILVLGAAGVVAIGVYIRPVRNTMSANHSHSSGLDAAGGNRQALPRGRKLQSALTPGEWDAFRRQNWPAKFAIAGYLGSDQHWAFWNRTISGGAATYGWDERVQQASLFPQWASGENSARGWAESVAREPEVDAVAIVDLFSHGQPSIVEWLRRGGNDSIERSQRAPMPALAESLSRMLEGLH